MTITVTKPLPKSDKIEPEMSRFYEWRTVWMKRHPKKTWLVIQKSRYDDDESVRVVWMERASVMSKYDNLCTIRIRDYHEERISDRYTGGHAQTMARAVKLAEEAASYHWFNTIPPRYMCTKPRDSQREMCYGWERKTLQSFNKPVLSNEDCVAYINSIYVDIKLSAPKVEFTHRAGACSSWGGSVLTFGKLSKTKEIILHEIAHSIIDKRMLDRKKEGIVGHGPEWIATFVELLVHYLGYNEQKLRDTLTEAKIKVADKGIAFEA
jgi:hypothetical protein